MDILKLLDVRIAGGGFIQGKPLMIAIEKRIGNPNIEDLKVPFGCVATSLSNGKEHWLRKGSLLEAVRASIALPGIFASIALKHDIMLDGGLVNPVPISLARAMGADYIIAVNLNSDLVGRHFSPMTAMLQPTNKKTKRNWNMLKRMIQTLLSGRSS